MGVVSFNSKVSQSGFSFNNKNTKADINTFTLKNSEIGNYQGIKSQTANNTIINVDNVYKHTEELPAYSNLFNDVGPVNVVNKNLSLSGGPSTVNYAFLSNIWDDFRTGVVTIIDAGSTGWGYVVDFFDRDKKVEIQSIPTLNISDGYWGQGMVFNGDSFVMARSASDDSIKIIITDVSGHILNEYDFPSDWIVKNFGIKDINHVNDLTYNYNENCYYLSTMTDAGIFKFYIRKNEKGETVLQLDGITSAFASSSSGICYDGTTNQYYSVDGDWVTVLDENMNVVKYFEKKDLPGKNQGIEAYDGKLLAIRYDGAINGSAIDVYDANTGELLKTYTIPTASEPEAISWNGKNEQFYLYSNNSNLGTTIDIITLNGLNDL